MAATEARRRDFSVDALKAIAISAVVWIHVSRAAGTAAACMRFSVPVFVALWAYYFEAGLSKRGSEQHRSYLIDRVRKLLIPYCFWSLLYALILRDTDQNSPVGVSMISIIKSFAGKGWPGQYFLLVLLQLMPVLLLLRPCLTKRSVWTLLLASLFLYALVELALWELPGVAAIGHRPFIYWLPYALLGLGQARGYFLAVPRGIPAIVAVVAMMATPFEANWSNINLPDYSPYIQVSVLLSTLGIMLAWPGSQVAPSVVSNVSHENESGRITQGCLSLLSQIGSNSYPIFLMNPMVMHWLPGSLDTAKMGMLELMMRSIIVILICWILGHLLRLMRLRMLIGE